MARRLSPSALLPAGLVMEDAGVEGATTVITVRSAAVQVVCPACGVAAGRVHSRYVRTLWDLPLGGRAVRLRLAVRRFRCDRLTCARRIFAERLVSAEPRARRTARLDVLVHHLGLALGGRPAASFARRLMLPVSNDTLLRVVRRHGTAGVHAAQSGGDRRLGLEAQSPLRHAELRPGAAADPRAGAGSRAGDGAGLARRPASD